MTTLVGGEGEIFLLRENAKKAAGVNKHNILRSGEAAFVAFQNFVYHAVERFACVYRIEEYSFCAGKRLDRVKNIRVSNPVTRTEIAFLGQYAQRCSIDLSPGRAFKQIGIARLPTRDVLARALVEINSAVANIEGNNFFS